MWRPGQFLNTILGHTSDLQSFFGLVEFIKSKKRGDPLVTCAVVAVKNPMGRQTPRDSEDAGRAPNTVRQ